MFIQMMSNHRGGKGGSSPDRELSKRSRLPDYFRRVTGDIDISEEKKQAMGESVDTERLGDQ